MTQSTPDKWTPEEDDIALDMWLDGRGLKAIGERFNRTPKGVEKRLERLAIGDRNCIYYEPGPTRKDRSHLPIAAHERALIRKTLEYFTREQKIKPGIPHLMKILMRPENQIAHYIRPPKGPGFGLIPMARKK